MHRSEDQSIYMFQTRWHEDEAKPPSPGTVMRADQEGGPGGRERFHCSFKADEITPRSGREIVVDDPYRGPTPGEGERISAAAKKHLMSLERLIAGQLLMGSHIRNPLGQGGLSVNSDLHDPFCGSGASIVAPATRVPQDLRLDEAREVAWPAAKARQPIPDGARRAGLIARWGARFGQARESEGLTLDELAQRAGVHPDWLGSFEQGLLTQVDLESLDLVAKAMGWKRADLTRSSGGPAGSVVYMDADGRVSASARTTDARIQAARGQLASVPTPAGSSLPGWVTPDSLEVVVEVRPSGGVHLTVEMFGDHRLPEVAQEIVNRELDHRKLTANTVRLQDLGWTNGRMHVKAVAHVGWRLARLAIQPEVMQFGGFLSNYTPGQVLEYLLGAGFLGSGGDATPVGVPVPPETGRVVLPDCHLLFARSSMFPLTQDYDTCPTIMCSLRVEGPEQAKRGEVVFEVVLGAESGELGMGPFKGWDGKGTVHVRREVGCVIPALAESLLAREGVTPLPLTDDASATPGRLLQEELGRGVHCCDRGWLRSILVEARTGLEALPSYAAEMLYARMLLSPCGAAEVRAGDEGCDLLAFGEDVNDGIRAEPALIVRADGTWDIANDMRLSLDEDLASYGAAALAALGALWKSTPPAIRQLMSRNGLVEHGQPRA